MRRIVLLSIAAASCWAQRPHYGGTLVVETQATTLERAPVFETLFRLDEQGRVQPALAFEWSSSGGARRWQFKLRSAVKRHDGEPLTAAGVAASLAGWAKERTVSATGDLVLIQSNQPMPRLPFELASAAAAITFGNVGTGPFRIAEWELGKRAVLEAFDPYWGGRPYLDRIEVRLGRSTAEQQNDFDQGRADVVELLPAEMRRQQQRGRQVWSSAPLDLIALRFARNRPPVADERVREALALSIDRGPIQNVLLQRLGSSGGGLLPQILSGYEFLFPADRDLARARELAGPNQALTLLVGDPSLRAVTDRIALNAREAGITVRAVNTGIADATQLRVRGTSLDPASLLAQYSQQLELPVPAPGDKPEELFEAERALLDGHWVVPLFHMPQVLGIAKHVRGWPPDGSVDWRLADVWLEPAP